MDLMSEISAFVKDACTIAQFWGDKEVYMNNLKEIANRREGLTNTTWLAIAILAFVTSLVATLGDFGVALGSIIVQPLFMWIGFIVFIFIAEKVFCPGCEKVKPTNVQYFSIGIPYTLLMLATTLFIQIPFIGFVISIAVIIVSFIIYPKIVHVLTDLPESSLRITQIVLATIGFTLAIIAVVVFVGLITFIFTG